MQPAEYWVKHLNLQPHPEGGFYKETYRAEEEVSYAFNGSRSISTAIYFLLRAQDKSLFHRIKSDEIWHYHAGDTLYIFVLSSNGLITHKLGQNLEHGDQLQVVIPANHWFGAVVSENGSYTLSGCTVAPGFDFRDFELAVRENLVREFSSEKELIEKLTL